MNDQLMDDFFRNKLKNHSAPVPPELWEKIMADTQKKPKGFWLNQHKTRLGIAALFFILAGSLSFYFLTTNSNSIDQNITLIQPSHSNSGSSNLNHLNRSNGDSQNQNELTDSLENSKHQQTQLNPPTSVHTKHSSGTTTGNHPFKNKSAFNTSTNAYAYINQASIQPTSTITGQQDFENSFAYNQVNALPAFKNNLLYNSGSLHLPPLNLRRILGLDACPNANGSQRNDWYIELYGSPDYTLKSVMDNGASANYLQKKDSSEHMKGGFTIGARFSKTIGEHTYLKLGLQYSQMNELFSQRKEDQTQTTTVIVRRTITTPQGTTTTITDTSSVTQIGYRVIKSMNHYKNLELPVMLGYEFGLPDDNWRIALNGGLIFDLSSWYMGETLDTSLQVVNINSKSNNGVYQHAFTTSIYGSMGIYRRISAQMDVFAEPYFRYNILGMNSLYGVNQRFGAVGLSIGTRIQLNGRRQHL
ncbi:hypothetical protein [Hydrotalea sp.]|uniref:hypothetical protein n=1 Tax=Hydrotalea sp. TaxID=2881279 RepID=UPI00262AD34D|nr:hypothetical protein [Hydrotalea sp.]